MLHQLVNEIQRIDTPNLYPSNTGNCNRERAQSVININYEMSEKCTRH